VPARPAARPGRRCGARCCSGPGGTWPTTGHRPGAPAAPVRDPVMTERPLLMFGASPRCERGVDLLSKCDGQREEIAHGLSFIRQTAFFGNRIPRRDDLVVIGVWRRNSRWCFTRLNRNFTRMAYRWPRRRVGECTFGAVGLFCLVRALVAPNSSRAVLFGSPGGWSPLHLAPGCRGDRRGGDRSLVLWP
jgi:hypothetical protein